MLLEEEVITLLRIGLLIVIVPVIALICHLMIKYKRYGFGWLLIHLLLFSGGAFYWVWILDHRSYTSSIYNSVAIAFIGILWAISMVFFIIGLLNLTNNIDDRRRSEDVSKKK